MNSKICTNIEQSQKLIELGIDIKTADMCWSIDIPDLPTLLAYPITDCDNWENKIPAWSLAALLGVLPNNEHISTTVSRGSFMIATAEYLPNTWWCEYKDTKNQTEFNISADNPIDACYKMILKLHELNLL